MDQWFSATGQDASSFVEGMRGASEQAVKVDLALRAVAVGEQLEAEPEDIEGEYARLAVQMQEKPNRVRKAYEDNDLVPDLVAQIRKGKALDWLLHNVDYVDPDGNEISRDKVLGHGHGPNGEHLDEDHDHDGHDHGHDHDHADEHDHDHDHGDHDHEHGDHDHDDTPESTEAAPA
jgi:trigger factor